MQRTAMTDERFEYEEPLVHLSRDVALLDQIFKDPAVWRFVTDDFFPGRNEWSTPAKPPFYPLVNQSETAVFLFHPSFQTRIYELHTAALPVARRGLLPESQAAIRWVFDNTPAIKVQTIVPKDLPHARRLAHRAGFVDEGVLRQSFVRGGKTLDQWILGILPGEV